MILIYAQTRHVCENHHRLQMSRWRLYCWTGAFFSFKMRFILGGMDRIFLSQWNRMKIRYVTAIFPLCEKHWSTKLTEMKIFNILISVMFFCWYLFSSQLVPKYYLYYNVSGLHYMFSCWLNELCVRLNLQFVVICSLLLFGISNIHFFPLFSTFDCR